ncbi:selenoprotein, Rdx type family protein [Rhodotorula toruloides]|uniref:Selenoprotein, Rdx type family protein n=1 Tax=Rhodotorula toruloides TaxID=5286 RepID=A0A511K710_RHOTO|nr:selenoprotein, Rdx type family protein [Rhodotorula toruloides]
MDSSCTDCTPEPSNSAGKASQIARPTSSAPRKDDPELLDLSTFEPPQLGSSEGETPRLCIEFCDRCRWLHRATWTQTELFLTFPPSPDSSTTGLRSISLVPRNAPETGGRFRVWLLRDSSQRDGQGRGKEKGRGWELVWDRKVEGGFPEMKELKQRIRNLIAPSQDLGHSDKPAKSAHPSSSSSADAPPPANTAAESVSKGPAGDVPDRAEGVVLGAQGGGGGGRRRGRIRKR